MKDSNPHVDPYCLRPTWRQLLVLWSSFVFETLAGRNLSRLARRGFGDRPLIVNGLNHLPRDSVFVLAVNHFKGSLTISLVAALLAAARRARPDLQNEYMLIAGRRAPQPQPPSLLRKALRWLAQNLHRRWAKHFILILTGNHKPDINSLREWRQRSERQPVIVFPEGKASLEFNTIRPGSGRWLASLAVPTVPVGIFWYERAWHVRFGPSLRWSPRSELHDLQLGLNIAMLMPAELAPVWQSYLGQWQRAHCRGAHASCEVAGKGK